MGPNQPWLRPNGPLTELAWLHPKPTQLQPKLLQLRTTDYKTRILCYPTCRWFIRHFVRTFDVSSSPSTYCPIGMLTSRNIRSTCWPPATSNLLGAMSDPSGPMPELMARSPSASTSTNLLIWCSPAQRLILLLQSICLSMIEVSPASLKRWLDHNFINWFHHQNPRFNNLPLFYDDN